MEKGRPMRRVFLFGAVLSFLVTALASAANLAIIDSGIDYKHKDLTAFMWTNSATQTTTADGTIYKDDTHGWNFADKNNQIIDYKYLGTFSEDCYKIFQVQSRILLGTASDDDKAYYNKMKADQNFLKELTTFGNFVHGTHVSGISSKNAPKSELIGLKIISTEPPQSKFAHYQALLKDFLQKHPRAVIADDDTNNAEVEAFLTYVANQQATLLTTAGNYAAAVKSDVANGSFGTSVAEVSPTVANLVQQILGRPATDAETKAYSIYLVQQIITASKSFVAASPNTLFVFAAGNDGTDNDTLPTSPANVKADNTIAVAATLATSSLASFSSYGATMVEVAAPGVAITSTIPGDQYLPLSGTSMAAPFVTNVAGLIKDANPSFKPADIKKVLIQTVDVKSFLAGKVSSSGIVNQARAVRAAELSVGMELNAAIAQARTEVADVVATTLDRAVGMQGMLIVPLPSTF